MKAMLRKSSVLLALCLLPLAGCRDDVPQALGTLEYDRVTLPAPVAARIVSLDVREGQRVEAGAALLPRMSAVQGKSVSVSVERGGRRRNNKKQQDGKSTNLED